MCLGYVVSIGAPRVADSSLSLSLPPTPRTHRPQNPEDVEALPTEYKVPVMAMVLKAGGQKEFDQVMQLYHDAPSNVEKKQVYNAIGATADPALKRRVLEWALSEIKLQDFFYPIGSVSASRSVRARPRTCTLRARAYGWLAGWMDGSTYLHVHPPHTSLTPTTKPPQSPTRHSHEGLELAWGFYQERFPEFRQKLATASPSLMDAVIVYSCGSFASEEKASEIEAFFAANPLPSSARKIAQTLERIRINARFVDRLKSEIGSNAFWRELTGPAAPPAAASNGVPAAPALK